MNLQIGIDKILQLLENSICSRRKFILQFMNELKRSKMTQTFRLDLLIAVFIMLYYRNMLSPLLLSRLYPLSSKEIKL